MMKLAVIGKDVSQSTSPQIHSFIAKEMGNQISYVALSIPEDEFEDKIDGVLSGFDGFNVTIPYKLSVIHKLSEIKGDALSFGAVNTVLSRDKTGYNTDGLGFALMLKNNGVEVGGKDVLLLGAGGAGRSVAKKLKDAGANVFVYDKFTQNAIKLSQEFKGVTAVNEVVPKPYYLIVNATGVGMHKTVGISPVSEEVISKCRVAVDLIYVPEQSEFLRIAAKNNKKTVNGKAMLFYQAYYSECIYFGVSPDARQAKELFEKYLKEV